MISGSGSFTKNGTGVLTLSGGKTFTGPTTINSGTLTLIGSLSSAVILANVANATLTLSGNAAIGSLSGGGSIGGKVSLSNYTLTIGSDNTNSIYIGSISGNGGLIKTGAGTLILTGCNYNGTTTIVAGSTLQIGNGNAGWNLGTGNIINNGTLIFNSSGPMGVSNTISGSGTLIQNGSGTLTISGNNTYTGGTIINTGVLKVSGSVNGSVVTLGSGVVINNSSLNLYCDYGVNLSLSNTVSGTGSVIKTGQGTASFTGQIFYTGMTEVQAGALWISGGTGSSTFVADTGANLFFGGGTYTLVDGAQLTGIGTGFVHLAGGILNILGCTNATNLALEEGILSGGGELILSGSNAWNGSTLSCTVTVTVGSTLNITNDCRNVCLTNATLYNNGVIVWLSNVGDSSIRLSDGAAIYNTGTFDIRTNGVMTADSWQDTSVLIFNNSGLLEKSGGNGTAGFTLNGSAEIILNNTGTVKSLSGTLTLDNQLTNSGILEATGNATLDIQGTILEGAGAALSGTEIGIYFYGLGIPEGGSYTIQVSADDHNYINLDADSSSDHSFLVSDLDRDSGYFVRIISHNTDGGTRIYNTGIITTLDMADIAANYIVTGLQLVSKYVTYEGVVTEIPIDENNSQTFTTFTIPGSSVTWTAGQITYGSPGAVLFKQFSPLIDDRSFPTNTISNASSSLMDSLESFAALNQTVLSSNGIITDSTIGDLTHTSGGYGNQNSLTFKKPDTTPAQISIALNQDGLGARMAPAPVGQGAGASKDPIRYCDGAVDYSVTDLASNAYGTSFGITRSWTNQGLWASEQHLGNGMIDIGSGNIIQINGDSAIAIVSGGTNIITFNLTDGQYVPTSYVSDTLVHQNGEFILTSANGTRTHYYDFSATTPNGRAGTFISRVDSAGNRTFVASWDASGKITEIDRSDAGGTVSERWLYNYLPDANVNAGLLSSVQLLHKDSLGQWQIDRQVSYAYYDGTDSNGGKGDLKTATIYDPNGNIIDTSYYRYYTLGEAGGYSHGLKYIFDYTSYARLVAALGDAVFTASDAQVASYAVQYFEYDSQHRVTRHDVQTLGSSDSNGIAIYTYQYFTSTNVDGANSWRYKTIEILPDGNQNIIYCNSYGEIMLKVFMDTHDQSNPTLDGQQWYTFYMYDDQGHQLWEAEDSAITGYSDTYADLLHFSDRTNDGVNNADYEYLSDTDGLIYVSTWYTTTTATENTAGGVDGYLASSAVRHGELGIDILQTSQDYFLHADVDGFSIKPVADSTTYTNTDGTGAITTSYNYQWYANSLQVKLFTTTLPTVTAAQNGSGIAATVAIFYDLMGRPVWTKNADGHVRYTLFGVTTGAVFKVIDDVNYALLTTGEKASFAQTGWALPSGLNLVTQYDVDGLGRTTQIVDPNGNVSYIVYDDVNHETRTYQGWNTLANQPTGVIIVNRDDRAGSYTETLTYVWNDANGVPVGADGRPTGAESLTDSRAVLQSLSRTFYNNSDQIVEKDQYFNLSGLAYSTDAHLGTLDTNYYATYYDYDVNGNLTRIQDADGTISIYLYDSLSRLTAEYIGTNDSTTDGKIWQLTNAAAGSNMTLVTGYEYDNGGVGDSNLTSATQYVNSNPADNYVTQYLYDWRDRLISTKDGVQATEDTNVNRSLTVYALDNLGDVLSISVYDADGLAMTDTNVDGIPDALDASTLRAKTNYEYDSWGRVYRTETFSVDPATGTVSSTGLVTQDWYDQRGYLIKEQSSSGLVAKYSYDGVGRLISACDTNGGGDSSWADAGNVNGDTVLDQDQYIYDANGNIIEVIHKDRFHNATGTGALGDATSGVQARVSYELFYYNSLDQLIADVNIGTNGGVSTAANGGLDLSTDVNNDGILDVLQGSVPACSDDVLVTSYTYTPLGLTGTITDAKGIVTKYQYDNLGRTIATIDAYTDGIPTDDSNSTTHYTYDGVGHVTSMTAVAPAGSSSQTTQYVYGVSAANGSTINSNNLLAYVMYPDKSTGLASASSSDQVHYTYDNMGEVLTRTDQNGTVHTYTYDILGRQISDTVTTLGSGVDGSVRRIDVAYDTLGNATLITSYADTAGTQIVSQIKREYNGLGQLTAEYQATTGAVNTASTPKVQYSYSDVSTGSRLLSMTYPTGRVINYNYNTGIDGAIGRLSSISDSTGVLEAYTYLGLSTTVIVSHPETGIDLTYVQQSGDTQVNTDGGDIYTGLDRFGDVIDQFWTNSAYSIQDSAFTSDRYQYAYDRNGNVTAKNNLTNSAYSEAYTYDNLNRLTSTTRNGSAYQSWDLDALGNSDITTDGVTDDRDFNSQNQIVGLSYDANGNTLTDEAGKQYVYDAWNHLVQVTDSSGTVLKSYTYNSLGYRITETTGSGSSATTTTLYYNANWQVVEEDLTTQDSSLKTTYVWSATYIDAMVCRDQTVTNESGSTTQRIYVIHDANFNVTAITDATGQIIERYAYDAYGKFTILNADGTTKATQTTALGWNYLHQGGRYDTTTGLYNFRNRDYNPDTQRWMQQDPLGYIDGANRYQYVGSSPIHYTDTMGLNKQQPSGGAGQRNDQPPKKVDLNDKKQLSKAKSDAGALNQQRQKTAAALANAQRARALVNASKGKRSAAMYERQAEIAENAAAQELAEYRRMYQEFDSAYHDVEFTGQAVSPISDTGGGYGAAGAMDAYDAIARSGGGLQSTYDEVAAAAYVIQAGMAGVTIAENVAVRSANGTADAAQGAKLTEFYRQAERYGAGGTNLLENGRYRFYGELKPAGTTGEMAGARLVREWNPTTGATRTWYETLDQQGVIRSVRPEVGGPKVHYIFDAQGNYVETR